MFLENSPISTISDCSKIYPGPIDTLASQPRRAHGLVYFLEGHSEYIYGDKIYTAMPGTVMYLPHDVPYTIRRFTACQCIYVDFLTVAPAREEPFVKNYPNSSQFRDCFFSMLSLFKQKRIGYEAEILSYLYKLISLIQIADRASYFPGVRYQKIAPAIEYINKNYCNGGIRMTHLAELSGVSTRYFNELFSVFFGVSPKEYIIRMQLDTARNLLATSNDPIGQIASACGFGDVYYFSKVFRKTVGMTPSEYRRTSKVL